jgi:hypothetical protein
MRYFVSESGFESQYNICGEKYKIKMATDNSALA